MRSRATAVARSNDNAGTDGVHSNPARLQIVGPVASEIANGGCTFTRAAISYKDFLYCRTDKWCVGLSADRAFQPDHYVQGPVALVFNFLSVSLNLRGKPVELRNRALAVEE